MKGRNLIVYLCTCLVLAFSLHADNINGLLQNYAKNPKGWSALNYAIEMNDFESAIVLVDYIYDFNRVDDGKSALYRAVEHYGTKTHLPNKHKSKLIQKLIKKGAELKGGTIYAACLYGLTEIVEAMLDTKIDISEFNGGLCAAAYSNRVDIVRLLLSKGIDVKVRNPLVDAFISHSRNNEIIELLLKAGADPNIKLGFDVPPLLYALGDLELTRILLKHGADPNVKIPNDRGNSILGAALERLPYNDSEEIVQLLLDYGAKLV